jgi:hypothetical protein
VGSPCGNALARFDCLVQVLLQKALPWFKAQLGVLPGGGGGGVRVPLAFSVDAI